MNQESVGVIARDGFPKLLQGPGCSRMGRDIALQNAATSHFHNHEHVQRAESGRYRQQKITRHDGLGVIADKRRAARMFSDRFSDLSLGASTPAPFEANP